MIYEHNIAVSRRGRTITLKSGNLNFYVDALDQLDALIADLRDAQVTADVNR